jgi:hypothetical protein
MVGWGLAATFRNRKRALHGGAGPKFGDYPILFGNNHRAGLGEGSSLKPRFRSRRREASARYRIARHA